MTAWPMLVADGVAGVFILAVVGFVWLVGRESEEGRRR